MSRTLLCGLAALVLTALAWPADEAAAQAGKRLASLSSEQIMSMYTETTWQRLLALWSGRQPTAASDDDGPPPTDCPPKPTQECWDSWKVKPVNPFE